MINCSLRRNGSKIIDLIFQLVLAFRLQWLLGPKSKPLQGFGVGWKDFQDCREARDLENLVDDIVQVADTHFALIRRQSLGDGQEHAQPRCAAVDLWKDYFLL